MSVIAICGVPGSGKTLLMTYLAKKKFSSENGLFKRLFEKTRYLNIYSNYPIKLDDKRYSFKLGLEDLNKFQKWPPDCDLIYDEFQCYFDSLDYKNFPKKVRTNLQFHRHYGINNIYILSQHPSRIVKQARVLINEFYDVVKFIKIPIIGIAILRFNIYYNYEDFGKSVNVKKEDVIYKFKRKIKLFRYKKVFKSYNTKYMRVLVDNKPYVPSNQFNNVDLSLEDIVSNFNIDIR